MVRRLVVQVRSKDSGSPLRVQGSCRPTYVPVSSSRSGPRPGLSTDVRPTHSRGGGPSSTGYRVWEVFFRPHLSHKFRRRRTCPRVQGDRNLRLESPVYPPRGTSSPPAVTTSHVPPVTLRREGRG